MSILQSLLHRLAERRHRRMRLARTLEIMSLPPEIQKDILRPEEDPAGTERARSRTASADCQMCG
jgi:hypothetical protein